MSCTGTREWTFNTKSAIMTCYAKPCNFVKKIKMDVSVSSTSEKYIGYYI